MLISVVAAMSLPQVKKAYESVQLKQAALNLSALMRYAQGRSASRQEDLRIEFDPDFSQYRLVKIENGEKQNIEGRMGRIFFIPQDISVECSETGISFYPSGAMDKIRIYLTSTNGRTYTISTKEIRGRVQVFEEKI
jgi:Tfp pilus assembly protein FimT